MRLKKVMLGGAALALVLGTGSVADARDSGRWKKIPVHFQPVDVVEEDTGYVCDAVGQCVAQTRVTSARETGDLEGTAIQGTTLAIGTTSIATVTSAGAYTGSVKGCGAGAFLLEGRARFSVDSGTFRADYQIVAGTGTGDLEGITGVFHQEGTAGEYPPAHGWVRCKVRS